MTHTTRSTATARTPEQDGFFTGRTAWVVGASSGIGAATARELAARGAHVVVSARRREALEQLAAENPERMTAVPVDITEPDSVRAAWHEMAAAPGEPDLVIVSAGYWKQTEPGTFGGAEFARHVAVNLTGLGNVLDVVIPAFVSRETQENGRHDAHHDSNHHVTYQRPVIASIASVAGYRGIPGGEFYGATKAGQINLLEALRGALGPRGVDVVTVCPGFVETDMTEGNSFPMPFMVSPERAADEICDGLAAGKPEIVFPKRMMAAMKMARLMPVRPWAALISRAGRNRTD